MAKSGGALVYWRSRFRGTSLIRKYFVRGFSVFFALLATGFCFFLAFASIIAMVGWFLVPLLFHQFLIILVGSWITAFLGAIGTVLLFSNPRKGSSFLLCAGGLWLVFLFMDAHHAAKAHTARLGFEGVPILFTLAGGLGRFSEPPRKPADGA